MVGQHSGRLCSTDGIDVGRNGQASRHAVELTGRYLLGFRRPQVNMNYTIGNLKRATTTLLAIKYNIADTTCKHS